jgi:hypothetical protein
LDLKSCSRRDWSIEQLHSSQTLTRSDNVISD